jgi:ClpP class serine protease
VGSIGVLMDGFGFTGLMDKLGIERRLMTAGALFAALLALRIFCQQSQHFIAGKLDLISGPNHLQ